MMPTWRPQLWTTLAVGLLIFVWTIRWQLSGLDFDDSWAGVEKGAMISDTSPQQISASAVPGPGHPLPAGVDLSDPDAPFVAWPLKRACDEVGAWAEGVTFLCDNNFGGVGNVRNFILTCVRYAVEAGATGLVMPAITKRRDDDIKVIYDRSDLRPFGYLFDEANFRRAMAETCPRMKIYDDLSAVPSVRYRDDEETGARVPVVDKIDPRQMGREWGEPEQCDFAELDHQSDRFGERFRQWVADPRNGPPPSHNNTRLFRGADRPGVLWEWPVFRDGPELASTFGGLCKFNRTMMRLGKKALANMRAFAREQHQQQQLDAHAHAHQGLGGGLGCDDDDAARFLGAHLRTEADAESFWPTYEEQEAAYPRRAAEVGLAVGYVASGDLGEARRLARAAREATPGLVLVSKDDLLDGGDLAQLRALSWDQQGLVDYVVLAGADHFVGNSQSSFSISVSLKRNLREDGLYARPYKVRPGGHGRSFVVGPMDRYYENWLFIWDAMWP